MKKCGCCGRVLSIGSFSKNAGRKDGLDHRCKDCRKEWRENNREYMKDYLKKYTVEHQAEARLRSLEYYRRNPLKVMARNERWRRKNSEAINASATVYRAISKGILKRSECCQWCGTGADDRRLIAHHASYEKDRWLDVVWICHPCHKKVHQDLKTPVRLGRAKE